MRRLLERLERWAGGAWGVPLALAGLGVLSYGLLAPRMGFYWDDFPITWIRETYGAAGLARYFSTNRPLWGLLYQASDALLGANPLATQVFGLVWRWAAAVMFWLLLRTVWPSRAHLAGWAAAAWMGPSIARRGRGFWPNVARWAVAPPARRGSPAGTGCPPGT